MTRSTSRRASRIAGAFLCVAGLALTGCTGSDTESQVHAFLATDADASDELPASVDLNEIDQLDRDSSRLVGERGGTQYFLAALDPTGVCVILVDPTSGFSGASCGASPHALALVASGTGGAQVYTAPDEIPVGWELLGDVLIVNPDATSLP
ncbi:hypothetical protein E3T55_18715 [Cryobacterium frigoriphilum]|uniref:Uncharacterized protein n=1 Tax=Cryobacterium frigoriphilum TaxID=1259150 RepID=A0A4R8ZU06_9MICO|nr:hypothetical protein [Cryobacterium frigoriphilum]TFD45684.1 hypothetical protein E3T55_18715 [Cryobacterium frigoriphilum]